MTFIRRLDHVGILVRDTQAALVHFGEGLGLKVVQVDEPGQPPVRLTYLDCGNVLLQLVEPLDPEHELALRLRERGEGVHHICFGVDDVSTAVEALSTPGLVRRPVGSGRGRPSGFVAMQETHGVLIECTVFDRTADVDDTAGWLPPPSRKVD